MNFFKIHKNSRVGYKKLSSADLGTRPSSHLTHIGLQESSLDYLQNFARKSISLFIYNDSCRELLCLMNAIKRANGTIDSPKIKSGRPNELIYEGVKVNSITKEIREIAIRDGIDKEWYLMWVGLENDDLVFFLFNSESEDFKNLTSIIGSLKEHASISKEVSTFNQIVNFLENKVNKTSISYLEELEIIAQTNDVPTKIIKPKYYDIEKAKALFQATGKKGEELVAMYLENLKQIQKIKDYKWMNQSRESSYPYDFEIVQTTGKIVYSDVKTTSYTFQQKMIFSNQELRFINQNSDYHVFRVYDLNEEIPTMKICENINMLSKKLIINIDSFERELLLSEVSIKELKLAISPSNRTLLFSERILLR